MSLDNKRKLTKLAASLHTPESADNTDMEFIQSIGPSLNELRTKQVLCDTIIEVEMRKFHVHRCLLAATSPYFRSMFTIEWTEGRGGFVTLTETNKDAFEEVLQFAYTGHAEINKENLEDLLLAADQYCYPALSELCVQYMLANIDKDNCLDYMRLADMFDSQIVSDKADTFILQNFETVMKEKEFLDWSKDTLCRFILCDELRQNTREVEVFMCLCKWLTHQPERIKLASELLNHIRFNLLTAEELSEHVIKCELVRQDKLCTDLVFESLLLSRKNDLIQTMTSRVPTPLKIENNSFLILNDSGKILAGKATDRSTLAFHNLSQTPNDVCKYRGVTYGKYVFLILDDDKPDPNTAKLLRFDTSVDKWQQMSGMKEVRIGQAVAVLGDNIVVIGGINVTGFLSTAEQYNIPGDKWQKFPRLPYAHHSMAACVCKDSLYASGGSLLSTTQSYNDVCVLHPGTEGWVGLAPMPERTAHHDMVSAAGNIYVLSKDFAGTPHYFFYQPESDQWTGLACNRAAIVYMPSTAAVYRDAIYILGQCKTHFKSTKHVGHCLLRLDHVQGELRACCVSYLDSTAGKPSQVWVCSQ